KPDDLVKILLGCQRKLRRPRDDVTRRQREAYSCRLAGSSVVRAQFHSLSPAQSVEGFSLRPQLQQEALAAAVETVADHGRNKRRQLAGPPAKEAADEARDGGQCSFHRSTVPVITAATRRGQFSSDGSLKVTAISINSGSWSAAFQAPSQPVGVPR